MAGAVSRVFLPGFAARAHSYADGLPFGWDALQPPSPSASQGSLGSLRMWAVGEVVERPGRTILAGHSMGAALAVLAAASVPEHVAGLLLVAPAGLPLRKPVGKSAASFVRQLACGVHPLTDALTSARELARAPRGAARLVRSLRRLDLSAQMERVRAAGIPTTVIANASDTLTTTQHCRRAAALLGAEYVELDVPGGHVWMYYRPRVLSELLALSPGAR